MTSVNSVRGRILFAPKWQRRTVAVLMGLAAFGTIVADSSRDAGAFTVVRTVLEVLGIDLVVMVVGYAVIVAGSYVQDYLDRRRSRSTPPK